MTSAKLLIHCDDVIVGGKSGELLHQAVSAPQLMCPIHLNQRETAVEQRVFGSAMNKKGAFRSRADLLFERKPSIKLRLKVGPRGLKRGSADAEVVRRQAVKPFVDLSRSVEMMII